MPETTPGRPPSSPTVTSTSNPASPRTQASRKA
jgi:hypothetical protein